MKQISKKLLLRIILGLVILLILPISIGIIYLIDKQNDSPFEVVYTSAWRLKMLGFENLKDKDIEYPYTFLKVYGDTCYVRFHTRSEVRKFIDYDVHNNETNFDVLNKLASLKNVSVDTLNKRITIQSSPKKVYYYYTGNISMLMLEELSK